jgi:hypothetical protein
VLDAQRANSPNIRNVAKYVFPAQYRTATASLLVFPVRHTMRNDLALTPPGGRSTSAQLAPRCRQLPQKLDRMTSRLARYGAMRARSLAG